MSLSISGFIKKRKEKKLREQRESIARQTGIMLSSSLSAEKQGFPFHKYLINAFAVFGSTYGSFLCLIKGFHIDIDPGPLFVTCIVCPLVLSFMYVSRKAKIAVYLCFLALILYFGFAHFNLVNGGISAIWNSILRYTDLNADLPFLREFAVYYDDEHTAMSFAICILAAGIMILQNISVSEKMDFRSFFTLSFIFLQFSMYFGFGSSKAGQILTLLSWMVVAGIAFSDGYNGLTGRISSKASVKKHRHTYAFVTDPANVSRIAAVWAVFIIALSAVTFSVFPDERFEVNLPTNAVKTKTERIVKNFMSYGFGSLFAAETRADSPGQLSNVSAISYDGRPDLVAELVNYRVDRVYLRNYTGCYYDTNTMSWKNPPAEADRDYAAEFNFTAQLLKDDYNADKTLAKSRHRMTLRAVDPTVASLPLFVPYYAEIAEQGAVFRTDAIVSPENPGSDEERVYEFYTMDNDLPDYSAKETPAMSDELFSTLSKIKDDAYKYSLNVPEKNTEAIKTFCETYGIREGDDPENAIKKITDAFTSDYEYTLRPGKVPFEEDYVNYFLLANKKGYCEHFATAAALVLRYIGIPARYAEGYVIDRQDFLTAESVSGESHADWIETPYVSSFDVSRVYIPDSSGHAWVEVFTESAGWVPAEVTTAISSDEGGNSLLANLFSRTGNSNDSGMSDAVSRFALARTGARIGALAVIFLALAFCYYLFRMLRTVTKRHRGFRTGGSKAILSSIYRHTYSVWQYYTGSEETYLTYSEFCKALADGGFEAEDGLASDIEAALYSGENPAEAETARISQELKGIRKQIVKKLSLKEKLEYFLVKFMW